MAYVVENVPKSISDPTGGAYSAPRPLADWEGLAEYGPISAAVLCGWRVKVWWLIPSVDKRVGGM